MRYSLIGRQSKQHYKKDFSRKNKLVHLQEQQKKLEDTYYHSQTLQTRQEEKQKLEQKHAELIQQESEINEIKQWITHYEFAERLVDTLTQKSRIPERTSRTD